jgi:excisionase family DNA binding protein
MKQKLAPFPPERPRARRLPDACQAIGVSRSHLYAQKKDGKIRLVRIGGRVVVPETEIDRLLSEGAA